MTTWLDIRDIQNDKLYGLFCGEAFKDWNTGEIKKRWEVWFYTSERGRNQGARNRKRTNAFCELVKFEIPFKELISMGKMSYTSYPTEKFCDKYMIESLAPKGKKA